MASCALNAIRHACWLSALASLSWPGCLCSAPPEPPPTAERVTAGPADDSLTPPDALPVPPAEYAAGPRIELSGRNDQLSFARSGELWGVAWRRETGRRTRLHIGDTCYEEVFFTAFNDDLELVLNQPVQTMKRRECVSGLKVKLVATPNGFAVSPSEVGARFDLPSKSFQQGTEFPPERPVAPGLPSPPQSELVYDTEVLEVSLGGSSVIRTWLARGAPAPTGDHQLQYQYSADGKTEAKRGTVMAIKQDDEHWSEMRLVRTGETVSLFVVVRHKIFRQQFGGDGEPLGELELLVEELDSEPTQYPQDGKSIHNFSAGVVGSDCVLLYTRGNGGMKVFSCKTGKKHYLGEAYHPQLLCAGPRCVISESGSRVRLFQP